MGELLFKGTNFVAGNKSVLLSFFTSSSSPFYLVGTVLCNTVTERVLASLSVACSNAFV